MTYCVSPHCVNKCGRKFTPRIQAAARRWWGSDDAPIEYAKLCDERGEPVGLRATEISLISRLVDALDQLAQDRFELPKWVRPEMAYCPFCESDREAGHRAHCRLEPAHKILAEARAYLDA